MILCTILWEYPSLFVSYWWKLRHTHGPAWISHTNTATASSPFPSPSERPICKLYRIPRCFCLRYLWKPLGWLPWKWVALSCRRKKCHSLFGVGVWINPEGGREGQARIGVQNDQFDGTRSEVHGRTLSCCYISSWLALRWPTLRSCHTHRMIPNLCPSCIGPINPYQPQLKCLVCMPLILWLELLGVKSRNIISRAISTLRRATAQPSCWKSRVSWMVCSRTC
jgi:hypothetical protein